MQIGDLVKMAGLNHIGVIVEIRITLSQGHHTHRVLFTGTGYDVLDGYHWCNPTALEVL